MGEIQLLDMGKLKKEVREERTVLKTTRCFAQKLQVQQNQTSLYHKCMNLHAVFCGTCVWHH
jgi:hypothetical protein